jgi:hypothetical protein
MSQKNIVSYLELMKSLVRNPKCGATLLVLGIITINMPGAGRVGCDRLLPANRPDFNMWALMGTMSY